MAIIELTQGIITTVDDDLYDELNSYLWYASGVEGRAARRLKAGPRKLIYIYHQILHVLPWVLRDKGLVVDHIDLNPSNNMRANLRVVSHKENMRNTEKYGNRLGVGFDNTHGTYKVYIDQPDKERINVGTYATRAQADLALWTAKWELGL